MKSLFMLRMNHDPNMSKIRLTDAEFFSKKIDTIRPGLKGIPDAVAAGDFA